MPVEMAASRASLDPKSITVTSVVIPFSSVYVERILAGLSNGIALSKLPGS